MPRSAPVRERRRTPAAIGSILAVFVAVVLAGCSLGPAAPSNGFAAGDEFSYMAKVTDAEGGATHFGLIAGVVSSDGKITGERRLANVRDSMVNNETTEFTGEAHEDGTATFEGIGPDGGAVTATLEDSKATMTTDQEPGIAVTSWQRVSLPAFNNAIQDAVRG